MYLAVAGPDDQPARAIRGMTGRLADSVGPAHPLTLTAVSALANALARAGEPGEAAEHGREALDGFRDRLGPDHPHTLTVASNLKTIQSSQNGLVDIDFTPLPSEGSDDFRPGQASYGQDSTTRTGDGRAADRLHHFAGRVRGG